MIEEKNDNIKKNENQTRSDGHTWESKADSGSVKTPSSGRESISKVVKAWWFCRGERRASWDRGEMT